MITSDEEIESLINKFGEKYRQFIIQAIQWVDKKEDQWGLERLELSREVYIKDLINHLTKGEDAGSSIQGII